MEMSSRRNIGNLLGVTWVPSLSTDEVTGVGPVEAVLAAGSVGVGHLSLSISPEGVEESVMGTSARFDRLALGKLNKTAVLGSDGRSESSGEGRGRDEERGESNHFDD